VRRCWGQWYINDLFHAYAEGQRSTSTNGQYGAEYTTAMLTALVSSLVRERLPATMDDALAYEGTPMAANDLASDESCASAIGCRWRARVTGTVQGERYKISYTRVERKVAAGRQSEHRQRVEAVMVAPGPEWWYPSEAGAELLAVQWPEPDCPNGVGGHASVELVEFAIEPAEENPPPPGGGGPGGGAGGPGGPPNRLSGGGCAGCGTGEDDSWHDPIIELSMGRALGGGSAGSFVGGGSAIQLLDVYQLQFSGQSDEGGVEVRLAPVSQNMGGQTITRTSITQVIAPQAVANVDPLPGGAGYQISFFRTNALTSTTDPELKRYEL
jgi:hypothetical protein